MNSIDTGPLYAKIAGLAVENAQSINENILLYIEIEEGVIGGAIFKEVGDKIYYYQCGTELIEATYELWNLLPDTDRWSIMNMDIRVISTIGGKTQTNSKYSSNRSKIDIGHSASKSRKIRIAK